MEIIIWILCIGNLFVDMATSFIKLITWPILILILWVWGGLGNSIQQVMKSLVELMGRMQKISFKELSITLASKEVPNESKILLTEFFVNQQKKEKLLSLFNNLTKSISSLCDIIKSNGQRYDFLIVKTVLDDLKYFRYMLEVTAPEKAQVIKRVIEEFNKKPISNHQKYFSICDGLTLLDSEWREKEPSSFQELIEIRNIIHGL